MSYAPPPSPPHLLGDREEMQSDLPRVVEVLHDLLRELVLVLDLEQLLGRQLLLGVVVERLENLVENLGVESSHGAPCWTVR